MDIIEKTLLKAAEASYACVRLFVRLALAWRYWRHLNCTWRLAWAKAAR